MVTLGKRKSKNGNFLLCFIHSFHCFVSSMVLRHYCKILRIRLEEQRLCSYWYIHITNMFSHFICTVKNKSRIREGGRQAGREQGENIGRGSEGRKERLKKSKPLTFNICCFNSSQVSLRPAVCTSLAQE